MMSDASRNQGDERRYAVVLHDGTTLDVSRQPQWQKWFSQLSKAGFDNHIEKERMIELEHQAIAIGIDRQPFDSLGLPEQFLLNHISGEYIESRRGAWERKLVSADWLGSFLPRMASGLILGGFAVYWVISRSDIRFSWTSAAVLVILSGSLLVGSLREMLRKKEQRPR